MLALGVIAILVALPGAIWSTIQVVDLIRNRK